MRQKAKWGPARGRFWVPEGFEGLTSGLPSSAKKSHSPLWESPDDGLGWRGCPPLRERDYLLLLFDYRFQMDLIYWLRYILMTPYP